MGISVTDDLFPSYLTSSVTHIPGLITADAGWDELVKSEFGEEVGDIDAFNQKIIFISFILPIIVARRK